jgi:catechol 2,3-dioxygenase-like lactoylglutathione lyase family enzyme
MTVKRMDHVGIVVEDLDAAVAFFVELGMELEGQASVGGEWADQLLALDGVQADIAMLRTPDGHSRIELSAFQSPALTRAAQMEPVNTPGIPRIAFVVGDVNETFDRLRAHGAELVGEIAQYEDIYLYGYVRGPADVIVGLVEELD